MHSLEGTVAPEFTVVDHKAWINSRPLTLAELRGHVVLIDFWTYTCVNCLRTLPHIKRWHEKYNGPLVIIGVHTPEFEFEKDKNNVLAAVAKQGIKYPVVLDNEQSIWNAFSNNWWPRKLLIDVHGTIRYDHVGEGGYEETEAKIIELLAEAGVVVPHDTERVAEPLRRTTTPELYAGSLRGHLGTGEVCTKDFCGYVDPGHAKRRENMIYLHGKWKQEPEYVEYHGEYGEGYLVHVFTAAEVNAVIAQGTSEVLVDGKPLEKNRGKDVVVEEGKAMVVAKQADMYNIISGKHYIYELKLVPEKGFKLFAFTFG